MQYFRASLTWVPATAALLAFSVNANAQYMDVRNGPGCGDAVLSREARIEHNRQLAEFYYQAYLDGPKYKRVYTWGEFGCIAEDATVVPGTYQKRPKNLPLQSDPKPPAINFTDTKEMALYWNLMPDFGTVPGTLVVYATEDGAVFRMLSGGHTADGVLHSFWELDFIQVNTRGQIVHWEFWNDTLGLSDIFREVFHKDFKDFDLESYFGKIAPDAEKNGSESQKH